MPTTDLERVYIVSYNCPSVCSVVLYSSFPYHIEFTATKVFLFFENFAALRIAMSARYPSSGGSVSALGESLHFAFSNKTAPNRFLKAAMTERLSSWDANDFPKRGIPSNELINVYRRWGEGGYGVILTGNIMIEFDQLEAPGNPIIPRGAEFSGERFDAFKKMGAMAKKEGSLIVAQVSHPGRQTASTLQPDPVSASDVQLEGNIMGMTFAKPHAASQDEIKRIIDGFAHAAEYLHKAGYDGIQLHSAHGYLLAQFISQTTNKRSDKYGGDLANRSRIIVEIAQEIRRRVSDPSFIVGIKLNSVEFQEGGFSPEEAKQLCRILEDNRFDFVELSGGTYEQLAFVHKRESTKKREAFFLDFADEIVPELEKTKTYVTGGLKTVGAMSDALKTVQGVGLARPACQEPAFPKAVLSGKVQGAIKQIFDENNFGTLPCSSRFLLWKFEKFCADMYNSGLTNVVAGSQIRQLGRDQEPFDGSQQENVDGFQKDMEAWTSEMKSGKRETGFVDVTFHLVPYVGAAAS